MGEFVPINSQEELDKVLASRLQRERDTVTKSFQTQIEERDQKITGFESTIADLNKQIETLNGQTGRVAELEAKVREYETASVKTRIARETGLPAELADRLSGADEAAMRADAENLAKLLKSQQAPAPIYRPSGEGANDGKDSALRGLLKKVRNEE
jgi:TolA-binding protein